MSQYRWDCPGVSFPVTPTTLHFTPISVNCFLCFLPLFEIYKGGSVRPLAFCALVFSVRDCLAKTHLCRWMELGRLILKTLIGHWRNCRGAGFVSTFCCHEPPLACTCVFMSRVLTLPRHWLSSFGDQALSLSFLFSFIEKFFFHTLRIFLSPPGS